jgi:hypothetical protein
VGAELFHFTWLIRTLHDASPQFISSRSLMLLLITKLRARSNATDPSQKSSPNPTLFLYPPKTALRPVFLPVSSLALPLIITKQPHCTPRHGGAPPSFIGFQSSSLTVALVPSKLVATVIASFHTPRSNTAPAKRTPPNPRQRVIHRRRVRGVFKLPQCARAACG